MKVTPSPPQDQAALQQAFALFTAASDKLSEQFSELQGQVAQLSGELAASNAALQMQLENSARLNQRLSILLGTLPAGVLEVDAAGWVTAANQTAEMMLGADLPGQAWQTIQQYALRATQTDAEWQWLDASGAVRGQIALATQTLPDGAGSIVLLTDITTLVSLQTQLAQHKKLASLGEMAAGLAHQLRTPLSTAILYAGHLTKPNLLADQRQRFAEKVNAQLGQLAQLIADMLLFVQGENTPRIPTDILAVVQDALQTVEPFSVEKNVALRYVGLVQTAHCVLSPSAMLGALVNVLENAIQHTPAQHTVTVTVSAREIDTQPWLEIAIQDQGPGIPLASQARLFEPFFTTRQGGTLDFTTQAGEGTQFVFCLPCTLSAEAGELAAATPGVMSQ